MGHVVRRLETSDLDAVRRLWGSNVLEDLEILSYDRWGPGIAVPADVDVPEVRVVTDDPGDGLPALLAHLVTSPTAFCLVAEEDDEVVGYVSGSMHDQGVNDFRYGALDELYVREDRRRRGLATELVREAMRILRDAQALQFKVEVPRTWREGTAFWAAQRHWEQDCLVYSLYD